MNKNKFKINITEFVKNYEEKEIENDKIEITLSELSQLENPEITKEQIIRVLKSLSKKEKLTYRDVICNALNSYAKDEVLTTEEKTQCYAITHKIFQSKEPEFTASEVAFIIKRIDKIYISPLICGRIKEVFGELQTINN